jgi:hypothetical protein
VENLISIFLSIFFIFGFRWDFQRYGNFFISRKRQKIITKHLFLLGFPHHLPIPTTHLSGTPDWRVLNNRPFPPSQFFHHHPHFSPHNMLAAIDRMERPFLEQGWNFIDFSV